MLLRFLHIFLANLVFFSSSGMTFHKHFCKGKYVGLSMVDKIELCCSAQNKVSPKEPKNKRSCCQLKKQKPVKSNKRACCSKPAPERMQTKGKIDYSYSSKCCYLLTDYLHENILSTDTSVGDLELSDSHDFEPILPKFPTHFNFHTYSITKDAVVLNKQKLLLAIPLNDSPPKLYLHFQSFLC